MSEEVTRKLTAILAADVAGYSRLMGVDEAGTRARFNAHLNELIEPAIASRRGRIVKTTGDALLVEFASVVDAVQCAVDIQKGMAERNADEPDDRRIVFRIGVNLGDVIIEGDDIHGDGVNVAARLEALADPGSVVVSGSVHEQVKGKVDFGFDDLGVQAVKNIAEPVHAFSVDSAKVIPTGDEPGVRDVLIDVKEAEKAGDFLFGFGVTSNSGLVGSIVLDLRNFDLNDWPRSFSELMKFRSFFGAGQRLRIELLPGSTVSRFRIDFTEPYFRDKPLRFDASAYFFERGRDDYDEQRTGTTVSLGKRFLTGRFQGWSGELSFRMEDVTVDDIDVFASSEVRDDQGSNFLAAVKVTAVRDRTDNRFVPTSGDRTKIAYEQVAGPHIFGKLTGGYTWYRTLSTDVLERKKVLKLRGEGGVILGDAPVFERFFAGGTGSILGFDFRGVGERDGIIQTNIGGDFLLLLSAEYSYPLVGEKVRGHVFLNTGTAGTGAYRAAIGTGVRLTLDLLGPVPLEFNLAMPVSSDSEDDEQVFSFLVGSLFR